MGKIEQMRILEGGVDRWNTWRAENPKIQIDLSHLDFTEAQLSQIDLSNAYLKDSDFSKADLSYADLSGADLSEVILSGTKLQGADLRGAQIPPASKMQGKEKISHEAREPDVIYMVRNREDWTPPEEISGSRKNPAQPGPSDLQLLFDTSTLSEEDIAEALAILNDLYVSMGGDELVITGMEQYKVSAIA